MLYPVTEEGAVFMAEQAAILVVDDDREIVGAIAAALEKEGYRVLRALSLIHISGRFQRG